jgi:lipopolysaccharide biosynthesis glycosyltransferase
MTNAAPIHCVFSIDNSYAQHLAVVLSSISVNSRTPLVAHIIHNGVSTENMALVEKHISTLPGIEFRFYEFDAEPYKHFRVDGYISLASYFRLFLTEILPSEIDKVLYLDSDIVVRADVKELWETRLDGALIGAILDPYANDDPADTSNARLGLPADHPYFNAGILLIDLAAWRRENLLPTFIHYIESNHHRLRYHDQDALNATLAGRVKYIDYKWNFQARTTAADRQLCGATEEQFSAWRANPHIVHYASTQKPWIDRYDVPFRSEYYRYLRMTPWRAYRPPDWSPRRALQRRFPLLQSLATATRGLLGG